MRHNIRGDSTVEGLYTWQATVSGTCLIRSPLRTPDLSDLGVVSHDTEGLALVDRVTECDGLWDLGNTESNAQSITVQILQFVISMQHLELEMGGINHR